MLDIKFTFAQRTTPNNPNPKKEDFTLPVFTFKDLDSTNPVHVSFIDTMLAKACEAEYKGMWRDGVALEALTSIDSLIAETQASRGIAAEAFSELAESVKAWLASKGKQGPTWDNFVALIKRRFNKCENVAASWLEVYSQVLAAYAAQNELTDDAQEVLTALDAKIVKYQDALAAASSPEALLSGL